MKRNLIAVYNPVNSSILDNAEMALPTIRKLIQRALSRRFRSMQNDQFG